LGNNVRKRGAWSVVLFAAILFTDENSLEYFKEECAHDTKIGLILLSDDIIDDGTNGNQLFRGLIGNVDAEFFFKDGKHFNHVE